MLKLLLLFFTFINIYSKEPISPIPLKTDINIQKAKLGKELFLDTLLSKDNSTACVNCHNIYTGGADSNVVSFGFNSMQGNIQSPTVLMQI